MAPDDRIPQKLWAGEGEPPKKEEVLSQIAEFLGTLGYGKTVKALKRESEANGVEVESDKADDSAPALMKLWASSHSISKSESTSDSSSASDSDSDSDSDNDSDDDENKIEGVIDDEAEVTTDDSSDEESESSSSESEVQARLKRKRVESSSESSSSESESESDNTEGSSDSDSGSDSGSALSSSPSSSSDDSDARPAKRTKMANTPKRAAKSSSSGSSSSSAASSSNNEDSDSSSDSSSSKEEDKAPPPPSKKKQKSARKTASAKIIPTPIVKSEARSGSTSSHTVGAESSVDAEMNEAESLVIPVEVNGGMHPDRLKRLPATAQNVTTLKKGNVPFQRIPADTKVDPRFASNEYVSYDYADRAFRDLSVTKGKGFTKEKNKKKRGSYRGGAIDLTPKGIKFDD